ncbi:MAG TPA: porin family protein [Candidatus Limnocylindria bacterium]|nr:porin family protein [Candidatus Limnocylindria bacterium]
MKREGHPSIEGTSSLALVTVLCTILCLVVVPALGFARVRLGVEAGVNLSTLRYDDELPPWDPGWQASFAGGTNFEIPLVDRFSLMTGPRYVRQGNRVKYDTGPGSVRQVGEFRVVQDYVSLPILLAFRPLPSRRFFVSLGPEIAYLLSGRLVVEETLFTGGVPEERSEYADIEDDLKKTNLSLDFGGGLEFSLEKHIGVLQLRYTHGVSGVAEKDRWFSDWKTRGIEGLLGVRW